MDRIDVLRQVELLEGLDDEDLRHLDAVCSQERYQKGETVFRAGEEGDRLYIVSDGFVEIIVGNTAATPRTVVNLGTGQLFGEMALVDHGPRSATVRALQDNTVLEVISRAEFAALCSANTRLGYAVMRNMAADLSFKLRHRNLMDSK